MRLRAALASRVAAANAGLADYAQIRGCLVVLGGFTVAGGQLTSSLKARRGALERRYAGRIDALYDAIARRGRSDEVLVMEAS